MLCLLSKNILIVSKKRRCILSSSTSVDALSLAHPSNVYELLLLYNWRNADHLCRRPRYCQNNFHGLQYRRDYLDLTKFFIPTIWYQKTLYKRSSPLEQFDLHSFFHDWSFDNQNHKLMLTWKKLICRDTRLGLAHQFPLCLRSNHHSCQRYGSTDDQLRKTISMLIFKCCRKNELTPVGPDKKFTE